jgi:hypothetical protein
MSTNQPGRVVFLSLIVVVILSLVGALLLICFGAAMR